MTATVTVIGVDGRSLPAGTDRALATARLVVGSRVLLGTYAAADSARTVELVDPSRLSAEALAALSSSVAAGEPAVVLTHGDPGHFGLLRALRSRGLPTVCWPSVSCL